MTNSEIFDHATAAFGGRFRREDAPERARNTYLDIQDRAQDLISAVRRDLPKLPDIHFDFILNGHINALAFKTSGRYFVGFNTGTVYMLRHVIGRMLSDARLFGHIGDPTAERNDLRPLVDYAPDADLMHAQEDLLTPRDPVRGAFADFVQDQAIMFLVGHELVHIVHGHVDYLNVKRQQRVTAELGAFEGWSNEERLERQALEQDADRRSIFSRIDSLRFTFENPKRKAVPWRPDTKHPVELLVDWALSVHVLFRLFGDIRFSLTRLADTPYPPLPLRRVMCEAAAFWAVGSIFGSEWQPQAREALQRARNETELAFSVLLGEEPSPAGLEPALSKEAAAHATGLHRYWHAHLVKVLQPFAYEELG